MNSEIPITLIRSRRRTMGIQIRGGEVLVRAPLFMSERQIKSFVREHRAWIESRLQKARQVQSAAEQQGILTPADVKKLADQARKVIPERVRYYAPLVGVSYGRIAIRSQRSRWGSCSAKGNLNFNCLLMLTPPEVLDSVVVHELCHLIELNHSSRFYREVLRVYPEYHKWHNWLRQNGEVLMQRLAAGKEAK